MSLLGLLLEVTKRVIVDGERSFTAQEDWHVGVVGLGNSLAVKSLGYELANVTIRSMAHSILVLHVTIDRALSPVRCEVRVNRWDAKGGREASCTRIVRRERGFLN